MTAAPAAPPSQPSDDDLTARIFRALYQEFDLRSTAPTLSCRRAPHGSPGTVSATSPARSATARAHRRYNVISRIFRRTLADSLASATALLRDRYKERRPATPIGVVRRRRGRS
jgi:hypothetical protein